MKKINLLLTLLLSMSLSAPAPLYGGEEPYLQLSDYQEYRERLEDAATRRDIPGRGFEIVESQIFPVDVEGVGELTFVPAIDSGSGRLVLFFTDTSGKIVFRTDQLETNSQRRGELEQPNERLSAVSFQDLDEDGLTDIVLITSCSNESGEYGGRSYKVGDVLFQKEGAFYRDYRLSDKINRFGMNKSIHFITSFVRDGYSTEFLYTATTQGELSENGFQVLADQSFSRQFEKLGRLSVLPGTYRMAEYTVFMVYLVNDQGSIVWSFQPMGEFEHLYSLRGIGCQDIDGDGLRDLVVLADYSYEGSSGESVVETDYSVYYQRTAGFYEDKAIKNSVKCEEGDSLSDLIDRLLAFWGWES